MECLTDKDHIKGNDMKNQLIKLANKIAARDFMDFPDYDREDPITDLAGALTVIIQSATDNTDEIESDQIYDYLNTVIEQGSDTGQYFNKVLNNAKEAFFNSVLKDLPLINSGDTDPGATAIFDEAADAIVKDLLRNI